MKKSPCGNVPWTAPPGRIPSASNPRFFLGFRYFFLGFGKLSRIGENRRNLRDSQPRGFERPRRSRSQHSNPGGARCLSSTSVAQMLAAASIKVVDALFGLAARNDAECCRRELLGRSWRRDWGMRKSQPKNAFGGGPEKKMWIGCSGHLSGKRAPLVLRSTSGE